MMFNQWKLLNHLKESIVKITSDLTTWKNVSSKILNIKQELIQIRNENSYKLPAVFKEIKGRVRRSPKVEATNKEVVQKWKLGSAVSKSSICSRTEFVMEAILTATGDNSIISRIEALIQHIKQYPEAKNKAVQDGAIRLVLALRSRTKNPEMQQSIRECLAILGYSDPVPGKGIRILAIDGGGIRGLLVLEMLKKLEELTGKKVHEIFDFFCGVSTGAILAYSMAIHKKSLDEIAFRYESISREVFQQSAISGTGRLVWSHAYYDTSLWEKHLREHLGDQSLISTARQKDCPKMCSVSAVVNQSRLSAYIFRNYSLPWRFHSGYSGGFDTPVWKAARASAAAPTYFEECKLGNRLHQDGGILVNNPTAIAMHEAKLLWPNTPIQTVVSFGTGRSVPLPSDNDIDKKIVDVSSNTSWANKFYTILDSATDTEAVHTMLNDLLPDNVYYRFNPYLTEMISMVEIDQTKIAQLKRDAVMYLRRNEDKFQEAAKSLTQTKSFAQKVQDYVNYKREMFGI